MVCVKVLLAELKAKEPAEEDILRCKQARMMAMRTMVMAMRIMVMKVTKMNSSEKSRRLGFPRVIWLAWHPGWESANKLVMMIWTQITNHTGERGDCQVWTIYRGFCATDRGYPEGIWQGDQFTFLAHIFHIILRAFDKVGTIGRAARFCELNLILQNFAEQRDVDLFDIDTPLILAFFKMFPHYWTPGVCEFNVRLLNEELL